MHCPLCQSQVTTHYHRDTRGDYLRCDECALVFLDPAEWPSFDAELARYELHENDASDLGYVRFLSQLAAPVVAETPEGARGLDFGSGESGVLATMLTRGGRPTVSYDPAFQPDESLLLERYDFVVCSEVLEHVHEPMTFLERLATLIKPNGIIGLRTGLYDAVPSFADWAYIRDATHVCFYSRATLEWIAGELGWTVSFPAQGVALYQAGDANGRAEAQRVPGSA